MFVMSKKTPIRSILLIIKMLDQKWIFRVFSHTLVTDVSWRQSMLHINGRGRKSKHTTSQHILLASLLSDV